MGKALVFLIFSVIPNAAFSQIIIIPDSFHDQVLGQALENFWGNAKLKGGSSVEPESEKERGILPIQKQNATDVIKAGELSALGKWCGLQWEDNFLYTTNNARKLGLSDKQVTFVSYLHGFAMGLTGNILERLEECSVSDIKSIEAPLKSRAAKPIDFTPSFLFSE